MYNIIIDHNAKDADIEFIRAGIVESTKNVLGQTDFLEKQFTILLKDKNNIIYGGIIAKFDSESVYIDALWVNEASRHQGYATKLLIVAEEEARKLGCSYSTLDTWSFQAEEFYLKNGYVRLGEMGELTYAPEFVTFSDFIISHAVFQKFVTCSYLLFDQRLILLRTTVYGLTYEDKMF